MQLIVAIQIVVITLTESFFFFSPIHCDVLGYKLKYSWSYMSLLSASDILRYIFCPAEFIWYIAIYFVLPINLRYIYKRVSLLVYSVHQCIGHAVWYSACLLVPIVFNQILAASSCIWFCICVYNCVWICVCISISIYLLCVCPHSQCILLLIHRVSSYKKYTKSGRCYKCAISIFWTCTDSITGAVGFAPQQCAL